MGDFDTLNGHNVRSCVHRRDAEGAEFSPDRISEIMTEGIIYFFEKIQSYHEAG